MIRTFILLAIITFAPNIANAACPPAPVGSNQDRVIQMVAGVDGVTQMAREEVTDATEEGAIVYDATNNTLAVCDGTNWVPLGGEAIYFESVGGTQTTGTAGVEVTATNLTEFVDSNAAFNPTTGQFTAPEAGFYQFNSTVNGIGVGYPSGGWLRHMIFNVTDANGICISYSVSPNTAEGRHNTCSGATWLDSGDVVSLTVATSPGNVQFRVVDFSGFAVTGGGGSGVLPQGCTTDQIAKFDGTAWVCEDASGGTTLGQNACEFVDAHCMAGHGCPAGTQYTGICPVGKYVAGLRLTTWMSSGTYNHQVYCCSP